MGGTPSLEVYSEQDTPENDGQKCVMTSNFEDSGIIWGYDEFTFALIQNMQQPMPPGGRLFLTKDMIYEQIETKNPSSADFRVHLRMDGRKVEDQHPNGLDRIECEKKVEFDYDARTLHMTFFKERWINESPEVVCQSFIEFAEPLAVIYWLIDEEGNRESGEAIARHLTVQLLEPVFKNLNKKYGFEYDQGTRLALFSGFAGDDGDKVFDSVIGFMRGAWPDGVDLEHTETKRIRQTNHGKVHEYGFDFNRNAGMIRVATPEDLRPLQAPWEMKIFKDPFRVSLRFFDSSGKPDATTYIHARLWSSLMIDPLFEADPLPTARKGMGTAWACMCR